MKKLNSYDDYKQVVGTFRKEHKKYFSNNYFMPGDIKRYIGLGRAYYECREHALLLYFDEECCYRLCVYADMGYPLAFGEKGKKIYLRVTYKQGKEDEGLYFIGNELEKNGFEHVSKTVQVRGDTEQLLERCKGAEKFARSLERKGFSIMHAAPIQYSEIEKFILESNIIKDYHLDYLTEEEKQELPDGTYIYISDKDGNICGASICLIDGEMGHGIGVAVKEQYKLLGFAPVLAAYRFAWLCDKNVKHSAGWIVTTNDASIRYHKNLGYNFTDKYADEWIKD